MIPSSGNIQLCFLYGEDFESYLHPVNDGSENPELKNKIIIPRSGKPIPVLIDVNKHIGAINKFVNLKARLTVIPNDIASSLGNLYNDLLLEYNNTFFNPFSEVGTFICLSLLDEETGRIEVSGGSPENAKAQVFVELHVEDLEKYPDLSRDIIVNSIPDLASDGIKVISVQGYEAIPYVTKGQVRVIYKEPNLIGLYATVDIFNNTKYVETMSALHSYSQSLGRNIQHLSSETIGQKLKTKTDFVFDPTKSPLFDSRGILNLKQDEFERLDQMRLRETADWYKNSIE